MKKNLLLFLVGFVSFFYAMEELPGCRKLVIFNRTPLFLKFRVGKHQKAFSLFPNKQNRLIIDQTVSTVQIGPKSPRSSLSPRRNDDIINPLAIILDPKCNIYEITVDGESTDNDKMPHRRLIFRKSNQ